MPQNRVKTPQKTPPRRRYPPKQEDYVIVNKPSGYCPKCRKFVPEEGVLCPECHAFWHYACADVTKEILDSEWHDEEFLCTNHRCPTVPEISGPTLDKSANVSIRVRVNSYTLNPESTVRKMLSSLNCQSKIDPKDQNQQYYVKLCLPTYEILVANLVDLGEQWGITIKEGGVDNKGCNVGTNFNMELCTKSGQIAQTSVNCHNTKSSLHIQLNKGAKGSEGWEEKIACLSSFVYNVLGNVIKQIENSGNFKALKEEMRDHLTTLKGQISTTPSDQLTRMLTVPYLHTEAEDKATDVPISDLDISSEAIPIRHSDKDEISEEIGPREHLDISVNRDEHAKTTTNTKQTSNDSPELTVSRTHISVSSNPPLESTAVAEAHLTLEKQMKPIIRPKCVEVAVQVETQLQDSLESLRIALKGKTDEISKLMSENKLYKQLQKDLIEKSNEIEEKGEKNFKNNEKQ